MDHPSESKPAPTAVPWRERLVAWSPAAFAVSMLVLAALDPDGTPLAALFVVLFVALLCLVAALAAFTADRPMTVFDKYNGYARGTNSGVWVGLLIMRLYRWSQIEGIEDHDTYSDIQTARGPLRLKRGTPQSERLLARVREIVAARQAPG